MRTVRAKDAAVMIASGKAKKADFEKIGNTGLYRYEKGLAKTANSVQKNKSVAKKDRRKVTAKSARDQKVAVPNDAIVRDIPILLAAKTPKTAVVLEQSIYGGEQTSNVQGSFRDRVVRLVKMGLLSQSAKPDFLDRYFQTSKKGLDLVRQIEVMVLASRGNTLDTYITDLAQ